MRLGIAAAAIILTVATPLALLSIRTGPALVVDESVAADLEMLAQATSDEFFATFRGQNKCIGVVRLTVEHLMKDRARYDPERSTIIVRVPGPPAILERAIVHELAHHLDFECAAPEVRSEFLAALGLNGHTHWFQGDVWSETPSEIFAEAAVEVVFPGSGGSRAHLRAIPSEAVAVVARWAETG